MKTRAKVKLKPCPFCGSIAHLYGYPQESSYEVQCSNYPGCGATAGGEESDAAAIERWNRRAKP